MSENLIKQMQFGVDTYDLVSKYIKDSNGNSKSWQDILDLLDQAGLVLIAVNSLPSASADTMGAIYLIPNSGTAPNVKDEYITVRSGTDPNYSYTWELIGSTQVDLDNYVQKDTYTTDSDGSHTHTASVSTTTETVITGLGSPSTSTASHVTVSAGSAASWSASVDANGVLSFSWSANTPTSVSASDVTAVTGYSSPTTESVIKTVSVSVSDSGSHTHDITFS